MHPRFVLALGLGLALVVPAAALGAAPGVTSLDDGAVAYYLSPDRSQCAIVDLHWVAQRSPGGALSYLQHLDVQLSGPTCQPSPTSNGVDLDARDYHIVGVTDAYVDKSLTVAGHQVSVDVAWTATGTPQIYSDLWANNTVVIMKSVSAHLTGTVTVDGTAWTPNQETALLRSGTVTSFAIARAPSAAAPSSPPTTSLSDTAIAYYLSPDKSQCAIVGLSWVAQRSPGGELSYSQELNVQLSGPNCQPSTTNNGVDLNATDYRIVGLTYAWVDRALTVAGHPVSVDIAWIATDTPQIYSDQWASNTVVITRDVSARLTGTVIVDRAAWTANQQTALLRSGTFTTFAAAPTPATAPQPSPTPEPSASPPQAHRVIVRPGDTLSGIAQEHGLPLQVVLDANEWIVNPNLIHPGDTIEIPQVTILADFGMVPVGATQPTGRVRAVIQSPTDWPEVPGTFRFDGAPGTELRAIRGVVEQVEHWYDPNYPSPGSGGSDVGFVLGHECQYWASRQPTCRDINWMFVDTLDPAIADHFFWCTWTDGKRPPRPADGDWCSNGRPGTESQWSTVTGGSLKVVLNE